MLYFWRAVDKIGEGWVAFCTQVPGSERDDRAAKHAGKGEEQRAPFRHSYLPLSPDRYPVFP